MTTVNTSVDDTAYVLVSSVDSLVQNKSPWPARVYFGAALPAAGTENYHVLAQYDTLLKSAGVPAGNIYARASDGRSNLVAVSA